MNNKTIIEFGLLLAEFSVRTENHGQFRSVLKITAFIAQARSAQAKNRRKKTRIRNLQYGPKKRG